MNNKPWAYVTSAWSTDRTKARRSAKRYCRKLYEAGYTPICPLLSLPEVIDVSNADEYKDYMDMSEDMLRRSRILVVCGSAVNETVLTDIAIANRFHVASSTMRGVLDFQITFLSGCQQTLSVLIGTFRLADLFQYLAQ